MQRSHSLDQKKLRIILILAGLIIWLLSLESLLSTKDSRLMRQWLEAQEEGFTGADYILLNIISYVQSILIPLTYALYCFIADRRYGMTQLAVSVWTILLAASALLYLIRFDLDSILYYPIVILFLILQIMNRYLLPDTTVLTEVEKEKNADRETIGTDSLA